MLAARPALQLAASWQLRQAKKAAKLAADELKAAALEMIPVDYIMPPVNPMETLARLGPELLEAKLLVGQRTARPQQPAPHRLGRGSQTLEQAPGRADGRQEHS
mgnify:CR=1 FL=1